MSRILATVCLIMLLVGCRTTGTYEQTSQELTGLELIEPHFGYYKSWAPIGSKDTYSLTDKQKAEQTKALNLCLNQLKSSSSKLPTHALRSVLLVQCMKKQGWHLIVEELFITR
ncbi:conserved hypothetical protein [Shewanella loihica PV-4]|uniref:Lipoprotein n=1 Tax=Shewanella loihica (strain ATCC BAA-1088 / PV-4) TaxID=323850 RepID=A3QG68_SHELP|nr:conserved hypothetical protein [Shewanella loihica PV-4]